MLNKKVIRVLGMSSIMHNKCFRSLNLKMKAHKIRQINLKIVTIRKKKDFNISAKEFFKHG